MKRFAFVLIALVLADLAATAAEKPNIVYVLCDDL